MISNRIVVCGGAPVWINSMKQTFSDISFYDALLDRQALQNADTIFFQTHVLDHKYYYRAINIARRMHKRVEYFEAKSFSRCRDQLFAYLESCASIS